RPRGPSPRTAGCGGRAPAGRSAGPPAPSAAGRERGDGHVADLRLAALVHDLALEVDAVLAVLLVLLLHGDPGRERLAGPGLLGEAHLVLAQVADADEVGERLAQDPGREHAVPEHARQPRVLGFHLVG